MSNLEGPSRLFEIPDPTGIPTHRQPTIGYVHGRLTERIDLYLQRYLQGVDLVQAEEVKQMVLRKVLLTGPLRLIAWEMDFIWQNNLMRYIQHFGFVLEEFEEGMLPDRRAAWEFSEVFRNVLVAGSDYLHGIRIVTVAEEIDDRGELEVEEYAPAFRGLVEGVYTVLKRALSDNNMPYLRSLKIEGLSEGDLACAVNLYHGDVRRWTNKFERNLGRLREFVFAGNSGGNASVLRGLEALLSKMTRLERLRLRGLYTSDPDLDSELRLGHTSFENLSSLSLENVNISDSLSNLIVEINPDHTTLTTINLLGCKLSSKNDNWASVFSALADMHSRPGAPPLSEFTIDSLGYYDQEACDNFQMCTPIYKDKLAWWHFWRRILPQQPQSHGVDETSLICDGSHRQAYDEEALGLDRDSDLEDEEELEDEEDSGLEERSMDWE